MGLKMERWAKNGGFCRLMKLKFGFERKVRMNVGRREEMVRDLVTN